MANKIYYRNTFTPKNVGLGFGFGYTSKTHVEKPKKFGFYPNAIPKKTKNVGFWVWVSGKTQIFG